MTRILAIILAIGTLTAQPAAAGNSFPKQMRGVWAGTPGTCATYKNRGASALKKIITQGTMSEGVVDPEEVAALRGTYTYVTITGTAVSGVTEGRVIRTSGPRSVLVQDSENPNIQIDFTLLPDGFLEETVVGARASMMYLRCR